ncbi:MAG: hypothetical protein GXP10_02475 [Gammaproteobacteria bacterium]|nr:hypothetical protein [Gammaproteobacteria bacterium]
MKLEIVADLLKEYTGLHSVSIGMTTIGRAVARRMEACNELDMIAYCLLLRRSLHERQAMINEVMVPETWFFRDQTPFLYLKNFIDSEWLPNNPGKTLRVLSMPCSTGEEPYSLAMLLMDSLLDRDDFTIDALDVSSRALNAAKKACYSANAFRGDDVGFRERYFHKVGSSYQLNRSVRDHVTFHLGNILEKLPERVIGGENRYDVIFCRNVLIYFDRATQQRVVNTLECLLRHGGRLFVGHAEAGCVSNSERPSRLQIVNEARTFAFFKGEESTVNRERDCLNDLFSYQGEMLSVPFPSTSLRVTQSVARQKPDRKKLEKSWVVEKNRRDKTRVDQSGLLQKIQCAADRGDVVGAETACTQYLKEKPTCVSAHYLLATIYESQGRHQEASDAHRKALYLDPKHYASLIQLAGYAERCGNQVAAVNYRNRARRIAEKQIAEKQRASWVE